jgi:hypothetical protein
MCRYIDWAEIFVISEQSNFSTKNKSKRRFSIALLVATVLLISLGGVTYVTIQREQYTTVVYEINGYILDIGVEWLYGEFRGMDLPGDMYLMVGIVGEIAEGNGGSVRYNFDYRQMTLTEYLQLNESEHDDLFGRSESGEYGLLGTHFGGGGWGGPIRDETYVWVLRFLEVGGMTSGSITISFQVIIRLL